MGRVTLRNYICPYCGDDCQKTRVMTVTALSVVSNVGWSQTKRGNVQYFHYSCLRANTLGEVRRREE